MLKAFFKRYRSLILFGTSSTLVFLFFYLSFSGVKWSPARGAERVVKFVLTPFEAAWGAVSRSVTGRVETAKEVHELRQELRQTRQELLAMQLVHDELNLIRREKEQLEKSLGFRKQIPFQNLPARVLFKDPQNLFTSFTVDIGTRDGVSEGDPVVGFVKGKMALIGKLTECEEGLSKVMTIIDQRCQVGVMLEDSGDTGIMKGRAPVNAACAIEYLDRRLDRLEGRTVVTSGLGGKYPKGILVGQITEVIKKRYGLFQETFLVPHMNFFTLDEVFILARSVQDQPR